MPEPVLSIHDLSVHRGTTKILDGIDWEIEQGQHWAVLGANGSGKTSLLRVLNAWLAPTTGEVTVFGSRYGETDWRELRMKIGIVSASVANAMNDAEPALESVISGKFAMIDYWGEPAAGDVREALAILESVEASHLAERPWQYLSQGERQRVLIGRALIADPRLLILDEPCAGLDPVAREHFIRFLERLGNRKNAPSIVFVTHHVEEIVPVLSHVLILKHGHVLASGRRESVLTSPVLSETFGAPVHLRRRNSRYALTVEAPPGAPVF